MTLSKIAQRRGILNKLREKTNVSGIAAEKFFNPEFEEVMNGLREADDHMRSIALGESVEGQDPGDDMNSLKVLVRDARSKFNRREYIPAVNFLGRFHKKVEDIVKIIKTLSFKVDKVHHDFLFKDLDPDQQEHLVNLKNRFAAFQMELEKHAAIGDRIPNAAYNPSRGLVDLLSNLTSTRGKVLSAWEKRYPGQVKKFKNDTRALLTRTENMLKVIETQMGTMASFRATRKPDDYMNAARKIETAYSAYDAAFKELYTANIKPFVNTFFDRKKEMEAKTETPSSSAETTPEELGNQEVSVPSAPSVAAPQENKTAPDLNPEIKNRDISHHPDAAIDPAAEELYERVEVPGSSVLKAPKTPDLGELEEEELSSPPDTVRSPPSKGAHQKFVSFLETMGSEDPRFLGAYITKYARQIEEEDPEAAIQLLQLARKIGS